MPSVPERIEAALGRLAERPGFLRRDNQRQLALFLGDLLESGESGAVEAPTGLGKSLAALIPAIAHALESGKRTVVSTYTNVLAEQYWRKDLPLALSLFDDAPAIQSALLMGRQRYVCLIGLNEAMPAEVESFRARAELGIEAEFRSLSRIPHGQLGQLWHKVSVPPVCPGRLCPSYHDCYFYRARQRAERAHVVVTNHSVVIQDALNARHGDRPSGMLGEYDYLIADEAHDLIPAAQSGLEFDLSGAELGTLKGVATRLESSLRSLAEAIGDQAQWASRCERFRADLDEAGRHLTAFGLGLREGGVLAASPAELLEDPRLRAQRRPEADPEAREIADRVARACQGFGSTVRDFLERWQTYRPEEAVAAREVVRNYLTYIDDFAGEASLLFEPSGVMVSYVRSDRASAELRSDTVGLAEPMSELVWQRKPAALLSATLAVDGEFEFVKRTLGFDPAFEEILPSPFDFGSQAALYLPAAGRIPDPSVARAHGAEEGYYDALAGEILQLLTTVGGRTMVLFHSRKEMEAVAARITLPPELPIYLQPKSGASSIGERFRREVRSSLFALRSFWTGFDAPGETLSCVALVRVPFEVPIEPPAVARMAYLARQGLDPFQSWTLPMAKMMIRQGAGRLIRSAEDRGVIALLDPRLRTKRYGEAILANLPAEMRTFDDIRDAVGWIGLEP